VNGNASEAYLDGSRIELNCSRDDCLWYMLWGSGEYPTLAQLVAAAEGHEEEVHG
jgi:hypothetical protein